MSVNLLTFSLTFIPSCDTHYLGYGPETQNLGPLNNAVDRVPCDGLRTGESGLFYAILTSHALPPIDAGVSIPLPVALPSMS